MVVDYTAVLCLRDSILCPRKIDTASTASLVPEKLCQSRELSWLHNCLASYDHVTRAHAQRTMHLAMFLARHLRLPSEEVCLVGLGALLHDIGKTAIPPAILHKPGRLTDQEWQMVRLHPELGEQMLSRIGGIFTHLRPIVVAHHERWDGRGYPAGLAGEQIPFLARVLAVVDSYDVMVSHRAYQVAQSVTAACKELRNCAGSQYDPLIVTAFLALLEG